MKIKELVTKIEKSNDKINLGKKYAKYINKTIFRIGFGIILLFCLYLVFTFGFDKSWVSIECTDRDSCINPYIYCSNQNLSNPYINYELKEYCNFYDLSSCVGRNCNTSFINSGDYIGEKPPRLAKNGLNIILLIVGVTFYFNYLYYLYKKRCVE